MIIDNLRIRGGYIKNLRVPMKSESAKEPKTNALVVDDSNTNEEGEISMSLVVHTPVIPPPPSNEMFWMFTGLDLVSKPMYPMYSNGSSAGSPRLLFNFGQDPFLGETNGFAPFDANFDSALWSYTSYDEEEKTIRLPGMGTALYRKTHQAGKYYFEVTLMGSSVADFMGLSDKGSNKHILSINGVTSPMISYIGTFRSNTSKLRKSNGSTVYNGDWGPQILTGDTLQIWVDFDKGNILVKKLGTGKEQYVNIANEEEQT